MLPSEFLQFFPIVEPQGLSRRFILAIFVIEVPDHLKTCPTRWVLLSYVADKLSDPLLLWQDATKDLRCLAINGEAWLSAFDSPLVRARNVHFRCSGGAY
jgi:hypothetical protein